jgi:CheY-like chemotaxis protein
MKYLTNKAHPDVQAYFAKSLSESGHDALVKQITKGEKLKGKGRLKIFAIDDSKMILSIYRTVLHNLGYDSQLFEFPAYALKNLKEEKPDVILTDLNMPDITGIDLTRSVRKSHTKEALPIIMVTTQDEVKDNDSAYEAGVNGILQKPFTESQIGKTIEKVTPK